MANELGVGEIKRGYEIGKADQRRAYIAQACPDCGRLAWISIHKGRPASEYCIPCANRQRLLGKKGADSIAWGGGRVHNNGGYAKVLDKEHARADTRGYVFEHIWVWEHVHSRRLPPNWVIHHLNGIRNDNRPENLKAMPRGLHIGQAQPYKQRIRELETKIVVLEQALQANQRIFQLQEN